MGHCSEATSRVSRQHKLELHLANGMEYSLNQHTSHIFYAIARPLRTPIQHNSCVSGRCLCNLGIMKGKVYAVCSIFSEYFSSVIGDYEGWKLRHSVIRLLPSHCDQVAHRSTRGRRAFSVPSFQMVEPITIGRAQSLEGSHELECGRLSHGIDQEGDREMGSNTRPNCKDPP